MATALLLAFTMVIPCFISAVFAEGTAEPTDMEPVGSTDRTFYQDYCYIDDYLTVSYSPSDADTTTDWSTSNTSVTGEVYYNQKPSLKISNSSFVSKEGTAVVNATSASNPDLSVNFNVSVVDGDPPEGTFTSICDLYPGVWRDNPNGVVCEVDYDHPLGQDVSSINLEQGKAYMITVKSYSDLCGPSSITVKKALEASGLFKVLDWTISMWQDDELYAGVYFTALRTGTGTIRIGNDKVINVNIGNTTAKWVKDSSGWWYDNGDGTYPANKFQVIDGVQYFFDSRGYMVTGWNLCYGWWFFFENSGAIKKNAWEGDYFLKENGMMAVSEWVDGGKYYVDQNGKWVKPGWVKDSTGWWYNYGDGTYPAGDFETIGGARYYFNDSGYMVTGWKNIDGNWYFFEDSGAAASGWKQSSGLWYYFDSENKMVYGWQDIGSATYYFDAYGAMLTDWSYIGTDWYYFENSGAMKRSCWVGNYWLKEDGRMARSEWVDGDKYYVDENGVWVPGA